MPFAFSEETMRPKKLLLRAAQRLHETWCATLKVAGREHTYHVDRLAQCLQAVETARRRIHQADRRGWVLAQARLRQDLLSVADELHRVSAQALARIDSPPRVVPSLRFLMEELQQIEADFAGLTIDWQGKAVCATTEPVTLKDVELGPFAIRFHWERLPRTFDPFCFDAVALEPHPAPVNDAVTHPHVKNNKVCAGEAVGPIRSALEQGRLADAFHLLRGVLFTYNPRSPHVSIDEWQGITCFDCECLVSGDDIYACPGCSEEYCADCVTRCHGCDDVHCAGCLLDCSRCQARCCRSCLVQAHGARGRFCSECRRSCARCQTVFVVDAQHPNVDRCLACRAAAPLPSGAADSASIPIPVPLECPDEAILESDPSSARVPA
jgi:hypothetical protein